MTRKNLVGVLFVFIALSACTQKKEDRFFYQVARVKGDLNKDGLPDLVVVKQDTLSEIQPYRLQIFFAQPDGTNKLIVSTQTAIAPYDPNEMDGSGFEKITVKNNVLTIHNGLLRGTFSHVFRYQHGSFELIGFSKNISDGQGTIYNTDFNLSTGVRYEQEQRYDTDKIVVDKTDKKMIRPLPALQDFVPVGNDDY